MPPSGSASVAPESLKVDARSASSGQAPFPSISSAPPPPSDEDDDHDDQDPSEAETAAPPEVAAVEATAQPDPAPEPEPDTAAVPPVEETLVSAPVTVTEPVASGEAVAAVDPEPVVAEVPASEPMGAGPETRPSATLPPPSPADAEKEAPVTVVVESRPERKKKNNKARPVSLTPPPVESLVGYDEDDSVESAEHVAIQEKFFSDGDLTRHDHDDELDAIRPSKAMRMAEPAVVERRERYGRLVKMAVAIAAVVCVAAIGRTLVMGGEPKEKIIPTTEATPSVPAPKVEAAKPVEAPKAEAPKPVETAAPEPAASTDTAASASPSSAPAEPPTGDAKEEKKNAQTALEHRRTAEAIAAGEKSVAIDPTDGEAWLILGAAYQEKGDNAAARRAFSSCVKEGKTGPVAECGKMLR